MLFCISSISVSRADNDIPVGPETEKRFPPLTIPNGFQATLFACDPLIEYPSVISLGPRTGTLFMACDYVTGLGIEIVRRDEVRLLEDTDRDGYADKSTVFAGGFNSIQGLAYYDDAVFVMHAPMLTSLRDTDGDGVADSRRDLIKGLGLPPEENSNRLHCANGVVAGHDDWLYLALGDRGCDVRRPEGDRLLFQQGGILRCRRDGSDLHVFSTGLRNIYDVALDEELNVFVRDNENDGGDYMIRVCHCFFGSDHGYPYHYYERPEELMRPLADLGRGSSAGATSYLETAFPKEYRESLFFCEWGRAVVRYPKTRRHSSFAPMQELDFAAGADNDPYGFKPTDLVIDRDGSLLISDWCDGQRPKRGRGRIYRITANGKRGSDGFDSDADMSRSPMPGLLKQIQSASYHQRVAAQLEIQRRGVEGVRAVNSALKSDELNRYGRLHAIWIIALSGSDTSLDELFTFAESDRNATVRAQAIRAIGDLTDPVLVHNKIEGGRGDSRVAERLVRLAEQADPRITLEILVVLRRLHAKQTPSFIVQCFRESDPALEHATQQALREARNWPGVLRLLDESPQLRKLALQAIAEQRVEYVAKQLIERIAKSGDAVHRGEYADAISRIVRQEKPWEYWGFRPDPRPAASVDWSKTQEIIAALNRTLADEDHNVRAMALQRMLRESVSPELGRLADWLSEETVEDRARSILKALSQADKTATRSIYRQAVARRSLPNANRLSALSALLNGLPAADEDSLLELAAQLEDGSVFAAMLTAFGSRARIDATAMLLSKIDSSHDGVRAAAIQSLAMRKTREARRHVSMLLDDKSVVVQRAAAEAAGLLGAVETADKLIDLARSEDKALIRASLTSLLQLKSDQAAAEAMLALKHRETQTAAVDYLQAYGESTAVEPIVKSAATNPSIDYQVRVVGALFKLSNSPNLNEQDAVARVQGRSGQALLWVMNWPLPDDATVDLIQNEIKRTVRFAKGPNAAVQLSNPAGNDSVFVGTTRVSVEAETNIEVLASATGAMSIWINGARVHRRTSPGKFLPDSDRFPAKLKAGRNGIVVKIETRNKAPQFQLRFRRRSSKVEHERLIALALRSRGNPERGRDVFEDKQKSTCLQCHRIGEKGGKIGPDLAGIGRRFSRIHLIESVLEPSRTIAPSYASVAVALNDGRVLTGILVSGTTNEIVLGDNQGKLHTMSRAEIDEIDVQSTSTMPEGLEKKLTDREFLDLLSFLESLKAASK